MNLKLTILLSILCIAQFNSPIQKEFEKLYDPVFNADEPGGSVLVKKGDQIIFQKSYGIADIRTKAPITNETIMNTGSISKTFVAYGILILEEEGKLSIEDNLEKYFDFEDKSIGQKVKIKHLLSHTSGLPDARNVRANPEFYMTAKDKANFDPILKVDYLKFEPGEQFEYSNPAFNGLALIIEKVSNQKWQDFIRERIFKPSGMEHSKITDGAYPDQGVAHAYISRKGKYIENDYGEFTTFTAAGNGGVWSTPEDLARYAKALEDHTFISKEGLEKSRTVFSPPNWKDASNPPALGYSWFIREKHFDNNPHGVRIISHTGSQGGFRAFYISIPEKDILYVAIFNRPVSNFQQLMEEGLSILRQNDWAS